MATSLTHFPFQKMNQEKERERELSYSLVSTFNYFVSNIQVWQRMYALNSKVWKIIKKLSLLKLRFRKKKATITKKVSFFEIKMSYWKIREHKKHIKHNKKRAWKKSEATSSVSQEIAKSSRGRERERENRRKREKMTRKVASVSFKKAYFIFLKDELTLRFLVDSVFINQ